MPLIALVKLLKLSLQGLEVSMKQSHVGVLALVYGLAPLVKVVFYFGRSRAMILSFSRSLANLSHCSQPASGFQLSRLFSKLSKNRK
jgi:hypothetical protein